MPAVDQCEPQIIAALEKAGWRVEPNVYIRSRIFSFYVDFAARRDSDQGQETIIIVEVKCFAERKSYLDDLYRAIGQYLVYRQAFTRRGLADALYLAIPELAYQQIFTDPLIAATVHGIGLKLIVVDLSREEITAWIA